MVSDVKIWIFIGSIVTLYRNGKCQIYTSCTKPMRCEIENNALFRLCNIYEYPGAWITQATPVYKTADMDCEKGRTYGRAGGKLWVTNSCHGSFEICNTGMDRYGFGTCFTPFKCNGNITTRCGVGPKKKKFITVAAVREQPDSSQCYSKTIHTNGNSLYVPKNCNGVFTICYANENDVEFTTKKCKGGCEIKNAAQIVSVDVLKVYARRKKCRELKIHHEPTKYLWMDGCVADVKVGYIPAKNHFTCTSQEKSNITCPYKWTIPGSVYFERELSDGLCIFGKTYGDIDDGSMRPGVWVAEGYSGVFVSYPYMF